VRGLLKVLAAAVSCQEYIHKVAGDQCTGYKLA